MTLASFIEAMPKVELSAALEGVTLRSTLLMLADQNEVAPSIKHFNDWVALIDKPDYKRLVDLVRMTSSWIQQAEDLTRITYDAGMLLAKQNVRYAEITVNPALYPTLSDSFEGLLAALNDGRDRAQRAWGIRMAWIMAIPRDEPRRADDVARLVTGLAGRRAGVVALGLTGREDVQPVGQFERAFRTAEKKSVPRVVRAGDMRGVEGVADAVKTLSPNRVIDARGAADSPELLQQLADERITVCISPTRAVKQGWSPSASELPLRTLYDADVPLVIGSDMPSLYHTTLNAEYRTAVEGAGLEVDELIEVALNAVRGSFLPDEEKAAMEASFKDEYARLRAEHLPG
jgi:aminodeoxyfutalosine deaminase